MAPGMPIGVATAPASSSFVLTKLLPRSFEPIPLGYLPQLISVALSPQASFVHATAMSWIQTGSTSVASCWRCWNVIATLTLRYYLIRSHGGHVASLQLWCQVQCVSTPRTCDEKAATTSEFGPARPNRWIRRFPFFNCTSIARASEWPAQAPSPELRSCVSAEWPRVPKR